MITLKNINKSYNNTKVLKNINLTLPDKGLICILGASGSGKSTLLNIIGKIEVPDKGEVYFYAFPIYFSIRSPMDFPSFFTLAYSAPKSVTAPKKMPPRIIHNRTGSHPNAAA